MPQTIMERVVLKQTMRPTSIIHHTVYNTKTFLKIRPQDIPELAFFRKTYKLIGGFSLLISCTSQ